MGIDKKLLAKKPTTNTGGRKLVGANKPSATIVAAVSKKPAAVAQKKKPIIQEESSSDDDDEYFSQESSSDDDSNNKQQLLDDSSDEELNSKTKAFSDSNKEWLHLKKGQNNDSDDEEEEDDSEEEDEEEMTNFEKKALKEKKKKEKIEQENIDETMKQGESTLDDDDLVDLPSSSKLEEESALGVDLQEVYQRIKEVINTLENFSKERKAGVSREDYMNRLRDDLATYFGYNVFLIEVFLKIFRVSETLEFLEANETQRPLTIRTNTLKTRRKDLADTLGGRGVHLEPIKWSPVGLTVYDSQVAIGATPEYLAGQYIQQSASSFLPVMALEPQPNERILDLCASPGGKTTYVAALMKNTGTLVANDVNEERMRSLVANIHRLGVKNTIVSNLDGREYPKTMGGFDRCLVDAPCVGLGVIAKDQQIKVTKSERDVELCVHMQKELLLHAIDSVDAKSPTGGIIVYSTCSLTVEENEGVVDYALKKRNVVLVDTTIEFGVQGFTSYRQHRFHPSLALTKRYYPHTHNMDGFYVAKFKKISNNFDEIEQEKQVESSEDEQVVEEQDIEEQIKKSFEKRKDIENNKSNQQQQKKQKVEQSKSSTSTSTQNQYKKKVTSKNKYQKSNNNNKQKQNKQQKK